MKRCKYTCAAASLALVCAAIAGARAQDTSEERPELSMVVIDHVKPSMMMEYEQATMEMIALFQEHNVDPAQMSFHTVSGPEIGYVYVMPMENFAAIDRLYESHSAIAQSVGPDRLREVAAKSQACVDHREVIHAKYRADLSFEPENPRLTNEEISFIHYSFLYVTPGHEEEFEQVARDFVALYAENDIRDPWVVHQVVTGDDLPLYVIADFGRSEPDFHTHMAANEEKLGLDAAALMVEGLKHIRKMETKKATMRMDLSYPPVPADGEEDDDNDD